MNCIENSSPKIVDEELAYQVNSSQHWSLQIAKPPANYT